MCFAFRGTTSTEDQTLDDVLTMTKITRTSDMDPPAPPSPQPQPQTSSMSDTSTSGDCVEVVPLKKAFSFASWGASEGNQAMTAKRAASKVTDEYEESEEDDDQDVEELTTTPSGGRKRSGSSLVKGSAKKAKTVSVSKQREPSGKGDAYDDLCWRANKAVNRHLAQVKQLTVELEEMQDERDEAITTVSKLEKKIKSLRASEVAREAKDAVDLKATVQEMKVTLKAEFEKKRKSTDKIKTERQKEDLARARSRMEEAQDAAKDAKALAKDLKPEHSSTVQAREKKIAQLKEHKSLLEDITDKLKVEKATLEADKELLSKYLELQSYKNDGLRVYIKNLEAAVEKEKSISSSHTNEVARMKREVAAHKRSWDEKWQIQYDNAQNSARRASDIQRSVSATTRALNEAIVKRDELQTTLKNAEAELRMLRSGLSKADNVKQNIQD